MGSIRPVFIKRAAHELIEHYASEFTKDFETNKELAEKYVYSTKKVRNRIAGYITKYMETKEK